MAAYTILAASVRFPAPSLHSLQRKLTGPVSRRISFRASAAQPIRFSNKPLGIYWQDSWRATSRLTLNYGLRYDIEFPPQLSAPNALAQSAYNQLGLQKGIKTDTNNFQPRIGLAWDPKGDGKTVIRSSYGIFYDHPLLGLYFLGDASDGSKSGQLLFFGANPGCNSAVPPLSLSATNIFQGIAGDCFPQAVSAFGYEANQQRFNSFLPTSQFINQGYLTNGIPLISQPFGYPQSKNFVYAYSQQVNLTVEQDLGDGLRLQPGLQLQRRTPPEIVPLTPTRPRRLAD